jgi:hypothetical protein
MMWIKRLQSERFAAYDRTGELQKTSVFERSENYFRTSNGDITGSVPLVLAWTVINVYHVMSSELNDIRYRGKVRDSNSLQ